MVDANFFGAVVFAYVTTGFVDIAVISVVQIAVVVAVVFTDFLLLIKLFLLLLGLCFEFLFSDCCLLSAFASLLYHLFLFLVFFFHRAKKITQTLIFNVS